MKQHLAKWWFCVFKIFKNNYYKIYILGILFSLIYFHFFSNQRDTASVATKSSESSTSDLPSLEVGIRASCEVNDVEGSCTEERNVDLKNNSLWVFYTIGFIYKILIRFLNDNNVALFRDSRGLLIHSLLIVEGII